jgi:signal transduction histidine kinase
VHPVLQSVWHEPRPPNPPARGWSDWAFVGAVGLACLLEATLRPELPWRVLTAVLLLGLLPTVLWRRTRPLLMVAIAFGTLGVAQLATGSEPQMYSAVYLLVLPYSLFRWGSGRDAVIGAAIIGTKICLAPLADDFGPSDAIAGFVVVFSTVALGQAFRYRTSARLRELDQVKLFERERLARDLHDTVAHHVSAIAIRAQAGLATAAVHPDAATDALRVIEAEASRTLAEMRSIVHVLRRNQPAALTPSPQVGDLAQLARRTGAGPSVEVEVLGDVGDLPPSVGAAIYRLAQESITNAQRHARNATHIAVQVAADDTTVRLRVSDDGDRGPAHPAAPPGFGLIGMTERVNLLGGTLEAGPDLDRGWTVTAVLPRTSWAA